jgi:histidinol-phosphatase (PHP family)
VRELIDCHVHTERCGHATGSVTDCARAAEARALDTIVFTEHLALPDDLDAGRHLSMPPSELDAYLGEVASARSSYPGISIVTGLEADFLTERVPFTAEAIRDARSREHAPTVVLGSVHFIGDWAFDDPHHVEEWASRDVDEAWREYFSLWEQAAASEMFDVMSHPDLVKKFGHFPSSDPDALYRSAARTAAQAGVRIEVSTAGLRKPVGELYPGAGFLRRLAEAHVPAVVGSDAHEPGEVGYRIAEAYDALSVAGYSTVMCPLPGGGWKEIAL